ncbi:sensor histidine kinase [Nocardia spumae]|uniref:sensor histidine kinase n=1 Tax=Nocardia spumae TaxID=2887190 RepID=UPI001D151790|nr:sensor histidine kinase [Nocardia spumae]
MTAKRRHGGIVGRFTVQTWFQIVLGLMIVMIVIGAVVAGQVIARTNAVTDRLLDRTQPTATESYRLQSALVNQETGLRGFAIAGDPQFLEPYNQGLRDEVAAVARLRELAGERPRLLADLDRVESAARRWRTEYADPLIAAGGNARAAETTALVSRGKTLFDGLRVAFATQNADTNAAIIADRHELANARTLRDRVLIAVVVVVLLTGLALVVLIRRLVARPLDVLTASSLRVAGGEFDHHITARGPADLATVAEAVEQMRVRIVTELSASRDQQDQLARQAEDLDRQTVQLRRSNAELEQFAYVASHDLQEPLRKVAAFCQLLEKRYHEQLDDRGKQYIDYAVDGAKRMQRLINDLLTFSRVGRVIDGTEPVDLDATLDSALDNLSDVIEDSGTVIERPEQLPEITGDHTLLTMLWQNLIGNAVKFRAPDTAPRVRIECEPADDPAEWQFSVSDNGIGIAPQFAEKVFVIFQRLHSREEYSGTGIGLALCKKIVEYHGGTLWIDTTYTGGTRFRFTLAVRIAPALIEPVVEGVDA